MPIPTALGGPVVDLAIGDFTGDGATDLLGVVFAPGFAFVLLPNRGDGTFGAPVPIPAATPAQVVAPDLNSDGIPDLI